MRSSALLVIALAACTPADKDTTPAKAANVVEGKLVRLENGDAACYVVLEIAGAEQTLPGDFALCTEAQKLVGQVVVGMQQKQNVLAARCQGNPDCGQSDAVEVIMSLVAK